MDEDRNEIDNDHSETETLMEEESDDESHEGEEGESGGVRSVEDQVEGCETASSEGGVPVLDTGQNSVKTIQTFSPSPKSRQSGGRPAPPSRVQHRPPSGRSQRTSSMSSYSFL